jgi:glycosyltransferase involved in cell wall biosynthesis
VKRICFVSDECNGVSNAGGIGACVRGLSQWFAANGAQVDILITNLNQRAADLSGDATNFVNNVIFLAEATQFDKELYPPADEPSKSYHVYRFLKDRNYDEIHFNDWLGAGFYTAMARRQGLFGAAVVTHLHGSSHWVRSHNLTPPVVEDLVVEGLERSQIENSDLVISPSRYLLDWCRRQGVKLPQSLQRTWILPQWSEPGYTAGDDVLRTRGVPPGAIDEIVFFGRHERRKGFQVFVEAVAKLPDSLNPDITFIGRFDRVAREHTGAFALRKLRNYGGRLRFMNDLRQPEALDFLKRSRRALAVMPSLIENSPCVVGECFTLGIPFLAADVGGTAELVAEDSRAHCLTAPRAADLAAAIQRVVENGMPELVSTLNPSKTRESWLARSPAKLAETVCAKPLVSVCFTHYERPHLLRRAYDSMLAQTYDNIEIIIVDDGSRSPGAHAYLNEIETTPARFPVTVIRGQNKYLGAARNAAARVAKGEYLLFHDDDNFAEPKEVETFVAAAQAYGADVLTAQCYVFHEGEQGRDGPTRRIEFYPIGVGGVFSFFLNRFGDANALVRRSVFEEIGGFTEEYGVGFEDWEFFLKTYMRDKRMGVVPEPLFNYRASATGMLGSGNLLMDYERIYRAVEEFKPRLGADMLRLATQAHLSQMVVDRAWHQLGRERGSDLMREMMSVEPNSSQAIVMLSDLAMNLGRLPDAVEIGAKTMESREAIALLLRDPAVARRMRKSLEIVVLEPTQAEDAVFLEGWAIDGASAPLDLPVIWAAGRWLAVASVSRVPRPDVKETFQLASDRDLGFRLFAFASSNALSLLEAKDRGSLGRSLREGLAKFRGQAQSLQKSALLKTDDFECGLPAGPGWRGHIDRGGWQRATKIALPATYSQAPIIEIEASLPADPAIVWGDGTFDWGKKIAGNRSRFVREDHPNLQEITVLAPSSVRMHVVVS